MKYFMLTLCRTDLYCFPLETAKLFSHLYIFYHEKNSWIGNFVPVVCNRNTAPGSLDQGASPTLLLTCIFTFVLNFLIYLL